MPKGKGPTYIVPFKRRKQSKTNYRKRLGLIKSGLPRLVVRTSNKNIIVEFMEYQAKGDKVIAYANSKELTKYGWPARRNLPTAYLTGMLCSLKAKDKVKEFVLDIGLSTASKNLICFSAMKGAVDAGLKTHYDEKIIDESRIKGKHISKYANMLKDKDESLYKKRFSKYLRENFKPEEISDLFETVKNKIHETNKGNK
ncbi:50S ribosomal protein L18 [Candidatus Micrarchaeota archaeon]|nr:50S ribosomal protein L18 [Candidatus Micrarchaeota archaeon]